MALLDRCVDGIDDLRTQLRQVDANFSVEQLVRSNFSNIIKGYITQEGRKDVSAAEDGRQDIDNFLKNDVANMVQSDNVCRYPIDLLHQFLKEYDYPKRKRIEAEQWKVTPENTDGLLEAEDQTILDKDLDHLDSQDKFRLIELRHEILNRHNRLKEFEQLFKSYMSFVFNNVDLKEFFSLDTQSQSSYIQRFTNNKLSKLYDVFVEDLFKYRTLSENKTINHYKVLYDQLQPTWKSEMAYGLLLAIESIDELFSTIKAKPFVTAKHPIEKSAFETFFTTKIEAWLSGSRDRLPDDQYWRNDELCHSFAMAMFSNFEHLLSSLSKHIMDNSTLVPTSRVKCDKLYSRLFEYYPQLVESPNGKLIVQSLIGNDSGYTADSSVRQKLNEKLRKINRLSFDNFRKIYEAPLKRQTKEGKYLLKRVRIQLSFPDITVKIANNLKKDIERVIRDFEKESELTKEQSSFLTELKTGYEQLLNSLILVLIKQQELSEEQVSFLSTAEVQYEETLHWLVDNISKQEEFSFKDLFSLDQEKNNYVLCMNKIHTDQKKAKSKSAAMLKKLIDSLMKCSKLTEEQLSFLDQWIIEYSQCAGEEPISEEEKKLRKVDTFKSFIDSLEDKQKSTKVCFPALDHLRSKYDELTRRTRANKRNLDVTREGTLQGTERRNRPQPTAPKTGNTNVTAEGENLPEKPKSSSRKSTRRFMPKITEQLSDS